LNGSGTVRNNTTATSGTLTLNTANGGGNFTGIIVDHTTGTGTVAVTKNGAGTQVLAGVNTYSGITTIAAGTLQLGNGTTDGVISNSSNITNSAALVYDIAGAESYSGIISGTGSVTMTGAGMQTLSGSNTYTGPTTVKSGTVNVLVAGALNGSTILDVQSGGAFVFSAIPQGYTVQPSQTLEGNGTVTGTVTIEAGGAIQPHDLAATSGTLSTGALMLSNSSTISLNLGATSGDDISSTGIITLGGTSTDLIALNVTLTSQPVINTTYTILSGASLQNNGLFSFNGTALSNGASFDLFFSNTEEQLMVTYGATSDTLTAISVPEPEAWTLLVGGAGLLVVIRRGRSRFSQISSS
jgi:autotransporter-associated beta strand protein